jgi:hypothetical protein
VELSSPENTLAEWKVDYKSFQERETERGRACSPGLLQSPSLRPETVSSGSDRSQFVAQPRQGCAFPHLAQCEAAQPWRGCATAAARFLSLSSDFAKALVEPSESYSPKSNHWDHLIFLSCIFLSEHRWTGKCKTGK